MKKLLLAIALAAIATAAYAGISYSSSSSFRSSPSYTYTTSGVRPTVTYSPQSTFRPAPSYTVSSVKLYPSRPAPAYRTTTIIRSSPVVVVHHDDGFWHFMMWSSIMNHQTYGWSAPVYAGLTGYDLAMWTFVVMFIIAVLVFIVWKSREE